MAKKNPIDDIYDEIVLKAKDHVGGSKGFAAIGANMRRSVVALEILAHQRRMDQMGVDAASLVAVTGALYAEMNDQFPWED